MENRRALYNDRHKVKRRGNAYKPGKKERDRRLKARDKLGRKRELISELTPSLPKPAIAPQVLTDKCVVCAYPFAAPSIFCPNCRNCQACGMMTEDAYSNHCRHCGNHFDGPRLDSPAIIQSVGAP